MNNWPTHCRFLIGVVLSVLMTPLWALDHQHAAWTSLLSRHVSWNAEETASSVDYDGFGRDRAALARYLKELSGVSRSEFDGWTQAERRAFLINAYNAWTVELILTRYPKLESIRDLGSLFRSPWKQQFFTLLGQPQTLDGVEHGLLRGAQDFDDPRIHFAVNCASIGCPALRPEAFRPGDLDRQLEEQTVRFLRDRSRNRFDARAGTLYLSSIFDWYADDFDLPFRGATSRAAFLALYRDALGIDAATAAKLAAGEIEVDFLDYDWSLNRSVDR
jgi:hypothetical protein